MKFKMFVPYSQVELDVKESVGGFIGSDVYPTLEELQEDYGKDSEWTIIEVDDMMLRFDGNDWISFEDIGMN